MADKGVSEVPRKIGSKEVAAVRVDFKVRAADGGEILNPTLYSERKASSGLFTGNKMGEAYVGHDVAFTIPPGVGSYVELPDGNMWEIKQPSIEAANFIKSIGQNPDDSVFAQQVNLPVSERQGKVITKLEDCALTNETRRAFGLNTDSEGNPLIPAQVEAEALQRRLAEQNVVRNTQAEEAKKREIQEERQIEAKSAMLVGGDESKNENFGQGMQKAAVDYLVQRSAIRNGVAGPAERTHATQSLDKGVDLILQNAKLGDLTDAEKGYAEQAFAFMVMKSLNDADSSRVAENIAHNRREVLKIGERQNWLQKLIDRKGSNDNRLKVIEEVMEKQVRMATDKDPEKRKQVNENVVTAVSNIRVILEGNEHAIPETNTSRKNLRSEESETTKPITTAVASRIASGA